MTIRVIKRIENMFQTEKRPSGYPTYLVMCSECWKQFPMIKYEIWKTEKCQWCANKKREWINIRERKKTSRKNTKSLWMRRSKFYKKYQGIKTRCEYPNTHWFKNYWWRWIKCLWKTFNEFYDDMYESYLEFAKIHWEDDTTIDRIDVNGDYCKENCRWLTMKEQQSWKRNNHKIVYRWKEYPTIKWLCDKLWKNYYRVFRRITTYWWSVEDAIEK